MEFLTQLVLGSATFCFGIIGLTVILSIVVLIAMSHRDELRRRQQAWQKLAAANHLTFVPGSFFDPGYIVGDYGYHRLELTILKKGYGNSSETYTRLTVRPNGARSRPSPNHEGFELPLSSEAAIELLTPAELRYNEKAELKAEPLGRRLTFEQRGFMTDQDYLQFLFDWLGDLADAYHTLVTLGGEAVPALKTIAVGDEIVHPLATQVLYDIAWETKERLSYQAQRLFCPDCLTCCGKHKVRPSFWYSITFYGCRLCGQSNRIMDCPQGVTAVLDGTWPDLHSWQDGLLRVNWLARRTLFDFDRVEILRATDEEVERFAMQVGNDTDPTRKPRYKRMRCVVGPESRLSENTLRVLRHTFGQVEISAEVIELSRQVCV